MIRNRDVQEFDKEEYVFLQVRNLKKAAFHFLET